MASSSEVLPICHLPYLRFGDEKVAFFQGFHGPHHLRNPSMIDLSYAVDLSVPVGTIVVAAREGMVREFNMWSERFEKRIDLGIEEIRRISSFANWILLQHVDGTETLYCHLLKDSERVRRGQSVRAGQPLARTGLSGWIGTEPHLHFHMQQWMRPSLSCSRSKGYTKTQPFRFVEYDGPLEHKEIVSSATH